MKKLILFSSIFFCFLSILFLIKSSSAVSISRGTNILLGDKVEVVDEDDENWEDFSLLSFEDKNTRL